MELNSEEKKLVFKFLHNLKTDTTEKLTWKEKTNSSILIVDGTNLFIRGWSATPSMDDNGNHVGGIVASLKSLGYALKLICPTRCIVVFDGVGGSFKRRQLYSDYKAHRKNTIRLNRSYDDLVNATTEEENCKKQYLRFIQYLQTLPVNILSIDHVEADDVIAYLATDHFKSSPKVFIMSSDKDFLQLCSKNINVYSPTKKRIYGVSDVLTEYNIHPNNFILFRSMDGDDSDNINGIHGAGLKTVVKHFPWLNEEIEHTLQEIITQAEGLRNKYKVCNNIVEGQSIINRNIELMQLKNTALTTIAQLHCNECLETEKIPLLDKGSFYRLIQEDLMESTFPDYFYWVDKCFSGLDAVIRKE